jgi:hypothetical protein
VIGIIITGQNIIDDGDRCAGATMCLRTRDDICSPGRADPISPQGPSLMDADYQCVDSWRAARVKIVERLND